MHLTGPLTRASTHRHPKRSRHRHFTIRPRRHDLMPIAKCYLQLSRGGGESMTSAEYDLHVYFLGCWRALTRATRENAPSDLSFQRALHPHRSQEQPSSVSQSRQAAPTAICRTARLPLLQRNVLFSKRHRRKHSATVGATFFSRRQLASSNLHSAV